MELNNDTLAQGFSYPIRVNDSDSLLKAHKYNEAGGSYPLGCRNNTWHGGIHLVTDGPVLAVANGEVVAYRFIEEEFTKDGEPIEFSTSFVLCKHQYKSLLGNSLDYYSLYMQLNPKPEGECIPLFLKTTPSEALDESKLGSLHIPDTKERPLVSAGDIVGSASNHFAVRGKKFFHMEIFTPERISEAGSILDDPKLERFFAKKGRYVIPAGRDLMQVPLSNTSLHSGDYVTVLDYNDGGEYVKVQVTGLVRIVAFGWLNHVERKACTFTNRNGVSHYKATNLQELNSRFNGWMSENDEVSFLRRIGNDRKVLLPCKDKEQAQVWIKREVLGEIEEETNKSRLVKDTTTVFSQKPESEKTKSERPVILDSPDVSFIDQVKYAYLDSGKMVNIDGIEPQTPFTWAGYECMFEEPANHDAFVKIEHFKTVARLEDGTIEETETAQKLKEAITNSDGTFNIKKIYSNQEWSRRLSHLIIRSPSEWHYCDKKYAELGKHLGLDSEDSGEHNPQLEDALQVIRKSSFWDELKEKSIFDSYAEEARGGLEVYHFHPILFLHQLSEMERSGLTSDQKKEFFALIGLVRGAAADRYADPDTCKALSACMFNRLGKFEWSDIDFLAGLAGPTSVTRQAPTEEQLQAMLPHVAEVFKAGEWAGLSGEYVHFHASSENISDQQWDSSVLDTENRITVGGFTFYRYKVDIPNFATEFTIKELTLISGGDKGQSLPAKPGMPVSVKAENDEIRPYRYDTKTLPQWELEYSYTIDNPTEKMREFEESIRWQLRYEKNENGEITSVQKNLDRNGNRIQLTLPQDTEGYSVELMALGGVDSEPLCNPFTIALRRKEYLVFNGSSLKWFDEDGKEVPFKVNDTTSVNTLKAFTGSPDLQPPEGQDEVDKGPIPEGIWWLKRDNLRCIDELRSRDKIPLVGEYMHARLWPGGVKRWGKYRLWLEHDPETKNQGRTNLCVLGNESRNTGGNIHIYDSETDFTDMEVFKKNFVKRVESGGRLKMRVNYAKSYKKGDTGNDVLEINFRLAGFGGVLPDTEFTELTEKGVKQFQRDYMGMDTPTGIVDVNTLEAIDEFGEKYHFEEGNIKCPVRPNTNNTICSCGGFGMGQFKGEYRNNIRTESFHKYEYPGMHRSLIWALKAIIFYLEKSNLDFSFTLIHSGYRCWINNDSQPDPRKSTNHMGKSFDLHFSSSALIDIETIRDEVIIPKIGAQLRWPDKNKFSLEPSRRNSPNEFIAESWIHIDVREFDSKYLDDSFFTKNIPEEKTKKLIL
ncbi:hypothetical protein CHISP_3514 [Chitinispirillum alkaliphilum]|nr:hypothetical protein CHISP_3514 [Chitinispirillum alkaliphilum]